MAKQQSEQPQTWVVLRQETGSLTVAGERIEAVTPRTVNAEVVGHLKAMEHPNIAVFDTEEAAAAQAQADKDRFARKPKKPQE